MFEIFHIPEDKLVTGATRVQDPNATGAVVDLARLNPATRAAQTVPQKRPKSSDHHGTYTQLVESHAEEIVRVRHVCPKLPALLVTP